MNRDWHIAVAALALIGLAMQYGVMAAANPGALLDGTVLFFSFFTILTNVLVMVASIGAAFGEGRLHRWLASASASTAISVHITVVAVIFQLLLAKDVHLSAVGVWANLLLHQLVPALWLIGWLAWAPHGGISLWAPLRWLIYPLVYSVWIMIHGAITGWYPYPFMNVALFGIPRTSAKMTVIALFFLILGYVYRWIDGWLAERREFNLR